MIGDKLHVTDFHHRAAEMILPVVLDRLERTGEPVIVTVAGESGSGKSETAHCLRDELTDRGKLSTILCQDDYFHLPPKTNHQRRVEDISWVGPGEVRLDLMAVHAQALKRRPDHPLTKPLVHFEEDVIGAEIIEPHPWDVVIVEGCYTSLLLVSDIRAFLDRTFRQTKKARLARARDPALEFLEHVLEIEHNEIRMHKGCADVVVPAPPEDGEP